MAYFERKKGILCYVMEFSLYKACQIHLKDVDEIVH